MTPEQRKEELRAARAIARAVAEDVALAIRAGVEDAQKRGQPYATFAKTFKGVLAKHGWWGAKDQIDPKTGLPIATREEIPARVALVIQTNTRTARAAGEWTKIVRQKHALPLLMYCHGHPERDRPEHEHYWQLPIILPVDHEFWRIAYTPNGYNCTCFVRQLAAGEITVPGQVPEQIEVGGYQTYPGIPPEFAYNPGIDRLEGLRRAGVMRRK